MAGKCSHERREAGRSRDGERARGQIWKEIHAATEAVAKDLERRQMSAEEAKFYQEDWRAPAVFCCLPPRMSSHVFHRHASARQLPPLHVFFQQCMRKFCACICAVLQDTEHAVAVLIGHTVSSVHNGEQRRLDGGWWPRRLVDNKPYDAAAAPPQHAPWYRNFSTALLILMQARPSAGGGQHASRWAGPRAGMVLMMILHVFRVYLTGGS